MKQLGCSDCIFYSFLRRELVERLLKEALNFEYVFEKWAGKYWGKSFLFCLGKATKTVQTTKRGPFSHCNECFYRWWKPCVILIKYSFYYSRGRIPLPVLLLVRWVHTEDDELVIRGCRVLCAVKQGIGLGLPNDGRLWHTFNLRQLENDGLTCFNSQPWRRSGLERWHN